MRLPAPGSRGWIDGEPGSVERMGLPIIDPAIHAGLGVFETLALRDGRVLDRTRHLERLRRGADVLGVPLPDTRAIEAAIDAACRAETAPCAWLKLLATRGGRWVVLTGAMSAAEQGRTVAAVLLPWRRDARDPLLAVKTTSRAAQQLGVEWARQRGADDGLWLNTRGRLTEGCSSNLFVVSRAALYTAALDEGVLDGIVRRCVIHAARARGIRVHEGHLRPERLRRAHEAFLTNSTCGVRPVVRVDGAQVGRGEPGPVTARLALDVEHLRRAGW